MIETLQSTACASCPLAKWHVIHGEPEKGVETWIMNDEKQTLLCFCTMSHRYIKTYMYACDGAEAEDNLDSRAEEAKSLQEDFFA